MWECSWLLYVGVFVCGSVRELLYVGVFVCGSVRGLLCGSVKDLLHSCYE